MDGATSEVVLRYLEENLRRSIGTDTLAEHFGVSRRSLEMRFRQQMHGSIREHLIRIRLKEATRLLKYTEEPVETIAALTGFCNAPHFSRSFKSETGMSPSQYRKS